MKDRRILITCLILLLVACLVVGCVSIIGGWYYFRDSTSFGVSSATEGVFTPQEEVQTQTDSGIDPTVDSSKPENNSPVTPTGKTIEPDIARQMDEIQLQVILERGLKPTENIDRKLYSPDQLSEKITQDFLEDYPAEDARNDALILASFGLLNPDFDLHTFYTDLYSEQVAGFFDTESKEMVVVQGESFGGVERFVYAHEYTHALQDQNFDIENELNYSDEACEADSERCAAILALIEGDATLTQLQWFLNNASPEDQAELMEMISNETDSPIFDSAPDFIALGVTFPYEYGYLFVDHLHGKGGWGSVNRAFQHPPLSTEQILHPDRYPDDKPIQVILPELNSALSNAWWEELDRGVMGEWYTYLILAKGLNESARLDDHQAKLAAEGWGGDAYVVYYNADATETLMILQSTWDTPADADEFADSFRDYANGRFGKSSNDTWQGSDGFHTFYHRASTTTWILAPDVETAAAVWQTVQP